MIAILTRHQRQQVAAVGITAAAILGLCSCASLAELDVNASPVAASASAEASASPSAVADAAQTLEDFSLSEATDADWAAYGEGYEFSDEPQSVGEQWLKDNYPDLWDQGVRVITDKNPAPPVEWGDDPTMGVLVQYINGERAEGTEDIPLRFRGRATDINEMPTDVYPNMVAAFKDPSRTQADGTIGHGGYIVQIIERFGGMRGTPVNTEFSITAYEDNMAGIDAGGGPMRNVDTWEDAWQFIQDNGYLPNTPGARELYPGEIARVTVIEEMPDGSREYRVLNPETGEFVTASTL